MDKITLKIKNIQFNKQKNECFNHLLSDIEYFFAMFGDSLDDRNKLIDFITNMR